MSFSGYQRYRSSGVEWLGEVPPHWITAPLRQITSSIQTGPFGSQLHAEDYIEGGVPVINPSNIKDGRIAENTSSTVDDATAERLRQYRFMTGDIVFGRRGEMGRCAVASSDHQGWLCGTGSLIVRLRTTSIPTYMAAYFGTSGVREALSLASVGSTMENLSEQILARLPVPVPPVAEQRAIAAFLDRETAKIDALVDEQKRLIELLKEKRQAVISQAVTKGLDPNAAMKDSGVQWLGQVPEHWNTTTVGRACEFLSYGFTNPMPTTEEGPYLLTANDIDMGSIRYDTARRTSQAAYENLLTDKSRPQDGDVLLTKDGTLGRVAVHDGWAACINQSVAILRPDREAILSLYLATALSGGVYQGRMIYEAGGTTIKHIYISRLSKMPIAIPKLAEQQSVLDWLASALSPIDQLLGDAKAVVDLLQERRSAL